MHLDIKYWLHSLNLSQYAQNFHPYTGVQEILHLDEAALRDQIGIRNSSHRTQIASSLVLLRAKRNLRLRQKQQQVQTPTPLLSPRSPIYPPHNNAFVPRWSRSEFAQSAHNRSQLQQHSASVLNISRMQDCDVVIGADVSEAESLRRQLEWELNQDGRNLESHAWYHGPIQRKHAEELLKNDGEFLIRDSSSGHPGDLVLSTVWRGAHLHFIISKVVMQPDTVYASIQYRLEDEPFDTVADLVTCYVGSEKAITAATGAKIKTPVNRTNPLSFYHSLYDGGSPSRHPSSPGASQRGSSHIYSGRNGVPPAAGRIRMVHPTAREYSTQSLPRPSSASERAMMRRGPSDPSLSVGGASSPPVPPKPSLSPFQIYQQEDAVVDNSVAALDRISESVNEMVANANEEADEHEEEAGDQVTRLPTPSAANSSRLRKARTMGDRPASMTRNSFLDRRSCDLDAEETFSHLHELGSHQEAPDADIRLSPIDPNLPTLFNAENFQSALFSSMENKPLDMDALDNMSVILEKHSYKSIALHLLVGDLDVLGGLSEPALDNIPFHYRNHYVNRGVTSGIELCVLPHGEQLRQDLLERTHCLRLFVAVTILTCPTIEDRVAMLKLWIEVANESKTALGNLYGFSGVMSGLCMPQIQRLTAMWNMLRCEHTAIACNFETRMKRSHGSEAMPHAPNTTIPDLHSAILLWNASFDAFLSDDGVSLSLDNLHLPSTGADYGLNAFASHLDLVRSWSLNLQLYMRNSRQILEDVRVDEMLTDMFRTEFQLRFLWGSRGVAASPEQRYPKFEQVITIMSERCESN